MLIDKLLNVLYEVILLLCWISLLFFSIGQHICLNYAHHVVRNV